eukprot:290044-Pleurochrysis_carterae.AAC.2
MRPLFLEAALPIKLEWNMRPYLGVLPRVDQERGGACEVWQGHTWRAVAARHRRLAKELRAGAEGSFCSRLGVVRGGDSSSLVKEQLGGGVGMGEGEMEFGARGKWGWRRGRRSCGLVGVAMMRARGRRALRALKSAFSAPRICEGEGNA